MRTVGIVGFGYVGLAMANFFARRFKVVVFDAFMSDQGVWQRISDKGVSGDVRPGSRADINRCDLALICVPTPRNPETGACDTSNVEDVLRWLCAPLILIKSTVSPGTTDRLSAATGRPLSFSPEYCGESTYWTPYAFHTAVVETPFFIFGGPDAETVKLVDFYMEVAGPTKRYFRTTALKAELTKYAENCFYATKIAFSYTLDEICRAYGVAYADVRELWLADPRIHPMHTAVFEENDQPFSGKCLPKDLSALAAAGRQKGAEVGLLEAVLQANADLAAVRAARRKEK